MIISCWIKITCGYNGGRKSDDEVMRSTSINRKLLANVTTMNRASMKVKISLINKIISRNVSAVRGTGKKPPPMEQFDPLNPGEWQLGAQAKILPRLPEDTVVGNLTMGKFGLYPKKVIDNAMEHAEAAHHADSSSEARPTDAIKTKIGDIIGYALLVVGTIQGIQMITGVFWPWTLQQKKH
uniref:Uncharacterized protein n=1 Tax=Ditylenchus dipsaci TaxID=166011 RepID=A0A915EFK6_9BILA